jgi:hypothetical protein
MSDEEKDLLTQENDGNWGSFAKGRAMEERMSDTRAKQLFF